MEEKVDRQIEATHVKREDVVVLEGVISRFVVTMYRFHVKFKQYRVTKLESTGMRK